MLLSEAEHMNMHPRKFADEVFCFFRGTTRMAIYNEAMAKEVKIIYCPR